MEIFALSETNNILGNSWKSLTAEYGNSNKSQTAFSVVQKWMRVKNHSTRLYFLSELKRKVIMLLCQRDYSLLGKWFIQNVLLNNCRALQLQNTNRSLIHVADYNDVGNLLTVRHESDFPVKTVSCLHILRIGSNFKTFPLSNFFSQIANTPIVELCTIAALRSIIIIIYVPWLRFSVHERSNCRCTNLY